MFCTQCGQQNTNSTNFCGSCGNKLESVNIESPPSTQLKKEVQQPEIKQVELWNPNAAVYWSLLFTPIFGSYLQMKNWQALGNATETRNAKNWLIFSVIFISLIHLGSLFIWNESDTVDIFMRVVVILHLVIWFRTFARTQLEYVKEKLLNQYKKKAWGAPLIISVLITFIFYTILIMITLN